MSSLLLLLQPAGALVLAAVVLREQPTIVQVIGACVVCLGVLAASWTKTSQSRHRATEPGVAAAPEQLATLSQARTANST
jgi:drug/metabolite transporter (DMT)-like permease